MKACLKLWSVPVIVLTLATESLWPEFAYVTNADSIG
jgi:hypothetical protein